MKFVDRQEKLWRGEERPRCIASQQAIARFAVLPELGDRGIDRAVQTNGSVRREVVGEGGRRIEEQRQVVLNPARNHPVADVLVQRRLRWIAFEDFTKATAKTGAPGFVLRKLPCGQETNVGDRINTALRVDVEALDRLDRLVEEVDAIRQRTAHRKQIDQSSAQAVFAGRDDLGYALIAAQRELGLQAGKVELLTLRQEKCESRKVRRRRETIQRARRSDEQHVAFAARGVIERCQPLGDEVLVRGKVIVGKRFPIRKD